MKTVFKKAILGLVMTTTLSTAAFANNCESAYETKAIKRGTLNMGVTGAIGTAMFFTGLTPLFLIGAPIILGTKAIINKGVIRNQFDDVNDAIKSSIYRDFNNKQFLKIAKKINHQTKKDFNLEMDNATIAKLIYEADVRMDICPVVRTDRHGDEVRGAMPLRGFVKYIANVAGTGNTQVKIVNQIHSEE